MKTINLLLALIIGLALGAGGMWVSTHEKIKEMQVVIDSQEESIAALNDYKERYCLPESWAKTADEAGRALIRATDATSEALGKAKDATMDAVEKGAQATLEALEKARGKKEKKPQ